MKAFGWINGNVVLAITLGLTAASCAMQGDKQGAGLADRRLRTSDPKLQTVQEPDTTTKATIQATYGKLPLHFEANQGQTNGQVKFLSRGSGYSLFLTSTEAVLALRQQSAVSGQPRKLDTPIPRPRTPDSFCACSSWVPTPSRK